MADSAALVNAQNCPYTTAVNFMLSKGWKPFKAELKGLKLYFYKPPSNRSAIVKELFPTRIVPPSPEEDIVEAERSDDSGKASRAREDSTIRRKKPAYWGRRTHPQLVVVTDGVEKGTFEALVHEAVFPTTSSKLKPPETPKTGLNQAAMGGSQDGRTFSSVVHLCLPIHVENPKFENEFTRCRMNLVNGADPATNTSNTMGPPGDEPGWEELTYPVSHPRLQTGPRPNQPLVTSCSR